MKFFIFLGGLFTSVLVLGFFGTMALLPSLKDTPVTLINDTAEPLRVYELYDNEYADGILKEFLGTLTPGMEKTKEYDDRSFCLVAMPATGTSVTYPLSFPAVFNDKSDSWFVNFLIRRKIINPPTPQSVHLSQKPPEPCKQEYLNTLSELNENPVAE